MCEGTGRREGMRGMPPVGESGSTIREAEKGDDCSLRQQSIPIQLDCIIITRRRRNLVIYIRKKP